MLNYIHADLHRIFRRVSRWMLLILFYAGALGFELYQAVTKGFNSVNFIAAGASLFEITAIVLGMMEIQNVFADDFSAKTMQIAIGLGVSRPKIVLTKLIDFAVLAVLDTLVMTALFTLGGTVCGIHLMGEQVYLMFVSALGSAVFMTVVAAFTMIPVFYTQSTAIAILIYLVLSLDPVNIVLQLLSKKEIVMNLHLTALTFSSVNNTFFTQLSLRNALPIGQLIGIIIYLAGAYGLTVLAFNKRELEF